MDTVHPTHGSLGELWVQPPPLNWNQHFNGDSKCSPNRIGSMIIKESMDDRSHNAADTYPVEIGVGSQSEVLKCSQQKLE